MYLQAGLAALAKLPVKPANIDVDTIKIQKATGEVNYKLSRNETRRRKDNFWNAIDCALYWRIIGSFSLFNQFLTWLIS